VAVSFGYSVQTEQSFPRIIEQLIPLQNGHHFPRQRDHQIPRQRDHLCEGEKILSSVDMIG